MTGGRTSTTTHLSWVLTAALGLVGCEGAPTAPTPQEAPRALPSALPPGTVDTVPPSERPAYHPVAIRCLDTVVAPGHVLDCEADPSDNSRWRYAWTIEPRAGTFLSGHFGPRFRWQAPAAAGDFLLRLRVEPRTTGYTEPVDTSRLIYVRAATTPAGPAPPEPASPMAVVFPPTEVADNACVQARVTGGTAPYTLTSTPAGGWGTSRAACAGGQAEPTFTLEQPGTAYWSGTGLTSGQAATLTVTDSSRPPQTQLTFVTEQ